jgi:hypothetical protein
MPRAFRGLIHAFGYTYGAASSFVNKKIRSLSEGMGSCLLNEKVVG